MRKTKKKKNKRALVVKKDKELFWAGAQRLMRKPTNQKEVNERALIQFTAEAAKISPFGINILGNLPYFNEMGSEEKAEQYSSGVKFVYNWIKRSENDQDKAVCECKLVSKAGKDLCDWITGECSPTSMRMRTLAGYQNHLAQTRAKIRAIKKVFGLKIHKDMMREIGKMLEVGKISEEQASKIGSAITTSAEEVNTDRNQPAPVVPLVKPLATGPSKVDGLMAGVAEKGRITSEAKALGMETIKEVEKKIGLIIDWNNLTKKQASTVLFKLLELKGKK